MLLATTVGSRTVRCVLVMLALGAATGCLPFPDDPSPGGLTGITANPDGRLTLVAAWCGRPPDGVVVHRRVGGELVDQADLTAPPLTGSMAFLDLERLSPGWSLTRGDLNFLREQKYMAGGYNSKARMYDVIFDWESKKKVRPGQVIITEYREPEEHGHDVLVTTAEFTVRAQQFC